jgi:nucleoid-associated protein YgaU
MEGMRTTGLKIGLVATFLLIVGSCLVWDSVFRRGRAEPVPLGERFVVFEHGGVRPRRARAAPRRVARPPLVRPPLPRTRPKPKPESPRTWTVKKGESLSEIADRVYGESRRWPEIARANGIDDPDMIREGRVLTIP